MTDTYPGSLPGLTFDNVKTPIFSTRVLTAASGKEQRSANWSYPIWKFSLAYEFLRSDSVNYELQTLLGFCLKHQGMALNFYYSDPTDNTVTGQQIGIGDGTTTTFRLFRTFGAGGFTFNEPISYAPTITHVYKDGVSQATPVVWSPATSTNGYGQDSIQFVAAPANGVVITADFTFNFTCRFLQDSLDFSYLMTNFWDLKKIEFQSVK
jgi:uncharacterized protein (TIGR02217 family)